MGSKSGKAKFAVQIAIQARDFAGRVIHGVADGIRRSFDRVRKGIRSTIDFMSKLGTTFETIGGGIIAVAQKIASAITDTSDRLSSIAKVSQKTKVSAQVLQELGYAAEQSGVDTESLYKGIETLNRKLGQMKAGSKDLSSFLLRVGGPAFLKQVQGAQSTEEALELMLAALGKIEGEEKRAAFAMAVFGKSGEDIALLIAEGTEALKAQRAEAHASAVQTEENIQVAAEFGDELDKLKGAGRFVMDTAAIEAMRQLLPDLRDMTTYFRENREAVVAMAKEIGGGIATGVKAIRAAFEWIYENREAILDWAKGLAIVFGAAGLLGSITGIVAGLKTMLGLTAAGAGSAGAAAAGGAAAARTGAALAAGAVAGVGAAAIFLPDSSGADKEGTNHYFSATADERRRRLMPLGSSPELADIAGPKGRAAPWVFEGLQNLADAVASWKAPSLVDQMRPVSDRYGKTELVVTLQGPGAAQAEVTSVKTEPGTSVKVKQATGARTLGVTP